MEIDFCNSGVALTHGQNLDYVPFQKLQVFWLGSLITEDCYHLAPFLQLRF